MHKKKLFEIYINKILMILSIVSFLYALNMLWAAWYGSAMVGNFSATSEITGRFSNSYQQAMWYEAAKLVLGLLLVMFLSFFRKRISFFIMLLFFPKFISTIFNSFGNIGQWSCNQIDLIDQVSAILGLFSVVLVVMGLYYWYQLYKESKC